MTARTACRAKERCEEQPYRNVISYRNRTERFRYEYAWLGLAICDACPSRLAKTCSPGPRSSRTDRATVRASVLNALRARPAIEFDWSLLPSGKFFASAAPCRSVDIAGLLMRADQPHVEAKGMKP